MTIATISVRVPDEIKQEVKDFEKEEKLLQTSEATRKLLLMGLETWRKERAIRSLEQGKMSFTKAAQIAKMDLWEFVELVKERKIIWIKNKDFLKKDLEIVAP